MLFCSAEPNGYFLRAYMQLFSTKQQFVSYLVYQLQKKNSNEFALYFKSSEAA